MPNSTIPEIPANTKCQLVDGFAIVVQLALAVVAFSSLILKRVYEHPRRQFKVWLLDTLKQVFAAGMIHSLNVLVSLVTSSKEDRDSSAGVENSDPCVWYFLNIGVDTTVGVFILFVYLKLSQRMLKYVGISDCAKSGYYGTPPRLLIWTKQVLVFMGCEFGMKLTVVFLFWLVPWFETIGKWLLSPLEGHARGKVVIVMLVFPLIMNIIQAWLVDGVIKDKAGRDYALVVEGSESSLGDGWIGQSEENIGDLWPGRRRENTQQSEELVDV